MVKRPVRICDQCGRSHQGKNAICRSCRVRNKANQPDDELALVGGHWVTDHRGVQRWEEAG